MRPTRWDWVLDEFQEPSDFSAPTVIVVASVAVFMVMDKGPVPKGADQDSEDPVTGDSKVLVAYFSWSGNTKPLAEWVADEADGELHRIIPANPYPTDYDENADRAKYELDNNILPELSGLIDESIMESYDVILPGFPIWWYDLPMSVKSC